MSVELSFKCDICGEKFKNRDDNTNQPKMVSGMEGLSKRTIMDKDKQLRERVMQYKFDFCEKCSKKMLDHYFKLGGK